MNYFKVARKQHELFQGHKETTWPIQGRKETTRIISTFQENSMN